MESLIALSRRSAVAGMGCLVLVGCSSGGAKPSSQRARADLYNCEGCEGLAERDAASLTASTRMAPPGEKGDPLVVTGIVRDAVTGAPVSGVIVYAYQTDAAGLYSRGTPETEWSRRHGLLRGWVKTGPDGRYTFETIKPAPYPNKTMPAHIHLTIGEAGKRPYYIDDVVFDGEFGVTSAYRDRQELRGGSGIVKLTKTADGHWLARRDIVLERHPAA